MSIVTPRFVRTLAAAALAVTASTSAFAGTGCNQVINIFVWGCAPWDNNNGPKFPYFKKAVIEIPKKDAQLVSKSGSNAVLYRGTYYPLISNDGGGIVASGGGNLRVYTQQ